MRENGEIYTAGKSFTLDRMDIFAKKFVKVHFLLGNDFFVLARVVSGCRQEMAKSTFGLTLSAQLIDLPLHRQFGRGKGTLYAILPLVRELFLKKTFF